MKAYLNSWKQSASLKSLKRSETGDSKLIFEEKCREIRSESYSLAKLSICYSWLWIFYPSAESLKKKTESESGERKLQLKLQPASWPEEARRRRRSWREYLQLKYRWRSQRKSAKENIWRWKLRRQKAKKKAGEDHPGESLAQWNCAEENLWKWLDRNIREEKRKKLKCSNLEEIESSLASRWKLEENEERINFRTGKSAGEALKTKKMKKGTAYSREEKREEEEAKLVKKMHLHRENGFLENERRCMKETEEESLQKKRKAKKEKHVKSEEEEVSSICSRPGNSTWRGNEIWREKRRRGYVRKLWRKWLRNGVKACETAGGIKLRRRKPAAAGQARAQRQRRWRLSQQRLWRWRRKLTPIL